MRIHLAAVGTRLPAWLSTGVTEYVKRLPRTLVILHEVAPARHGPSTHRQHEEGARLKALIPAGSLVIALDERGELWTTQALTCRLQDWLRQGRDVVLLIGGPEGLSPALLTQAHVRWSLSPLTLPHRLARLIVVEQLYRALSLLGGHPYHRA